MSVPATSPVPHPVQVSIARQESYSRGLAILGCILMLGRYIALLPILIVLGVFLYVAVLVAWITQFVVLVTGGYPEGIHGFLTGFIRWYARAYAWLFGLTDKYPLSMAP